MEVRIISNTKKEPLAPAFIVEKAKDHVIFTGTAMIPGEPDCDDEIFTEDEVRKFRETYHEHGGIIDEEHTFLYNKKSVGEPIEDFLTPGTMKMTNIYGEEREYPRGTWVVKSKIKDPELMQKAEKGEIAYSPTTITKQRAMALASAKGRTLMRDVPEGVVYTLSLTTHPCIDNSCQVGKSDPDAVKYGKSISKENKSVLEKARDIINGLIGQSDVVKPENIGGDNVTKSEDEKTDEYVTKSDLDGFKEEIIDELKADKADPPKKNPEQNSSSRKCPNCGATVGANDKYCPQCGKALKSTKSTDEEEDEGTSESSGSKAIKNHDDGKDEVAFKSVEHYMGRNRKGRPIKRTEEE